ncbi:unnamed protein product [Mytilus edulis]|uniref:Mutator-like transposase domain-containing protein n=1 Tax=Mytilus edulis TaxID=6550 RepID=A0A8S3UHM9_MYTED|nr:unnamed protein product [Mytilus edulis]
MRLPYTVFESRVSHKSSKVLEVHDVEQSACPPMLLRPRPKIPEQIDEYLDPTFPDPDNHTYKHYVPSLVSIMLRNKGIEVLCPNHAGHCSANLAEDSVIGNETEYARQCTIELNDKLKIAHVTTDGDSKAVNGITNAQRSNVKILRDVRHLANSIKRAVQN